MASLAARRREVWKKKWFPDLARNVSGVHRPDTWPSQREGSLALAEARRCRDWIMWKLGNELGKRPEFPARAADWADGLAWEILDEKRAQKDPTGPPPVHPGPTPDMQALLAKYPRWERLGGFVATAGNLSDRHLDLFAGIGGDWVVPVMLGDDASGPANIDLIPSLRQRCQPRNIHLGGWHNYWEREDPYEFARRVARLTNEKGLELVVLDCEASVQGSTRMSRIALELRRLLPQHHIAVSTNNLNDSIVYNGRIENVGPLAWRSFWNLGIFVLPQWYNAPRYHGRDNKWTTADLNTRWLLDHGHEDNLSDPSAPGGRAVPPELVKGTAETTGLEGADLAGELQDMVAARNMGAGRGASFYLLENAPDGDFVLMGKQRGVLYAA